MTVTYTASFEYDTRAVQTSRGTVSASQIPTCFARAARKAIQDQRPKGWRSVVVVLERDSPCDVRRWARQREAARRSRDVKVEAR